MGRQADTLPPLAIRGGPLRGLTHHMAVASAQVKSCVLLAGLRAEGETTIVEPAPSRDHTERMIRFAGGRVEREEVSGGVGDGAGLAARAPLMDTVAVPGDFSSAAFFLVAALLTPGSEVTIENCGPESVAHWAAGRPGAHGRRHPVWSEARCWGPSRRGASLPAAQPW